MSKMVEWMEVEKHMNLKHIASKKIILTILYGSNQSSSHQIVIFGAKINDNNFTECGIVSE